MAKVSKDQEIERLQQEVAQLRAQQQKLYSELLQERIVRIDYQITLLTQAKNRSQEELAQVQKEGA